MKSVLFRVLALSLLVASARAQVTFTVTATPSNAALGYAANTSYTFVFTTVSSFVPVVPALPATMASSFTSSVTEWQSTPGLDGPLFSSITGPGLTGSLSSGVVMQDITAGGSGGKTLAIDMYRPPSGTSPIGFSANGTALNEIYLNLAPLSGSPFSFTNGGSYVDVPNYFGSYTGTYTFTPDINRIYLLLYSSSGNAQFAVSSVQIASAIPEPAANALLSAGAALGALGWWRGGRGSWRLAARENAGEGAQPARCDG